MSRWNRGVVATVDAGPTQNLRQRSLALLQRYQQERSIRLRNQLVELNLGLVRQTAHRFSRQSAIPYDDLEQLGSIGLVQAIERFDPQQGCAFSSFAIPYIRGAMLHYHRDYSTIVRIPRRWQTLLTQGQRAQIQLTARLGRNPSDQEIAVELGVALEDWQAAKQSKWNRYPVSLDATFQAGVQADQALSLGEMIPDSREQDRQGIDYERNELYQALSRMESPTRQILELIFLKNLTRKQIAVEFGVSPMTITRRVKKGLIELRSLMQECA